MFGFKVGDVENLLGLFEPWNIDHIEVHNHTSEIDIFLRSDEPMADSGAGQSRLFRWQHRKMGEYAIFVNVETSNSQLTRYRKHQVPPFLGDPKETVTGKLRDTILLGFAKKMPVEGIAKLMDISEDLVRDVIERLYQKLESEETIAALPLDSNPIWRAILTHQTPLNTESVALKLLLEKLYQEVEGFEHQPAVMYRAVSELRTFLLKNAVQLSEELSELGAEWITRTTLQESQTATTVSPEDNMTNDDDALRALIRGQQPLTTDKLDFILLLENVRYLNDEAKALSKLKHFLSRHSELAVADLVNGSSTNPSPKPHQQENQA